MADNKKFLDSNALTALWNRIKSLIDNKLSSFRETLDSSAEANGQYTNVSVSLTNGNIDVNVNEASLTKKITDVDNKIDSIEKRLSIVNDDNEVIDRINEVIDYFNGVSEKETGAALISSVANNTALINNLDVKVDNVNFSTIESYDKGIVTLSVTKIS